MCQYVSMSPLMHRYNRGKPNPPSQNKALNNSFKSIQRRRLNTDEIWCVLCFAFHVSFFFYLFLFFNQKHIHVGHRLGSGSCALYTRPTTLWTSTHFTRMALSVGSMYCSRDPQTSFFTKTLIKNKSHGTIHTVTHLKIILL